MKTKELQHLITKKAEQLSIREAIKQERERILNLIDELNAKYVGIHNPILTELKKEIEGGK